ncbi:LytR/AlgR family response regulator transcription factor [Ferruginibacter profundus]
MNCVILDDEPLAVELLSQYVADTENLSLSFATTDAFAAIQFIQKNEVDIIFLDVQMPELSGIQVLKIIGNNYKVIFTTAYTDYALEGYDYNITDYLLKPITRERFLKAVDKALATGTITPIKSTGADNDFIFIKSDSKMIKVNLNEILFIEGLKDYISIQTTKEKLITLQNLKTLEQHLSGTQFMRVHKSYIVALNKIDTIEKNRIFIGSEVIPVGETYRDIFLKRIEGNKL